MVVIGLVSTVRLLTNRKVKRNIEKKRGNKDEINKTIWKEEKQHNKTQKR